MSPERLAPSDIVGFDRFISIASREIPAPALEKSARIAVIRRLSMPVVNKPPSGIPTPAQGHGDLPNARRSTRADKSQTPSRPVGSSPLFAPKSAELNPFV